MYNSILKGLKLKKDILATYRKRAIDARFLSLADNNKNINVGQEEWILQLPVCKVADTRLANVLYNQDALLSGENSPKQLLLINNQLVTKLIKFFD